MHERQVNTSLQAGSELSPLSTGELSWSAARRLLLLTHLPCEGNP
jgi:hypothetical protein